MADKTVVMFLSDHGGYLGFCQADWEEFGETDSVTSNAPLRDGKASLYEGGIRIPWIVRWPGKIDPGGVCDHPVNQVDLYPTFAAIAGLEPLPRNDLENLLTNPTQTIEPRTFFWHWPHYRRSRAGPEASPSSAIRTDNWKLIEFFEDGRTELYDLAEVEQKRSAGLHATPNCPSRSAGDRN